MAVNESRRIPLEISATLEELTAAIEALTLADMKRLEKAARHFINGLGWKALGREWGELLDETVQLFYRPDGRRWKKNEVGLMQTLILAMKSVASKWKEAVDDREARTETDLITTDEDGKESFSIEQAWDQSPNVQKELEGREKLKMAREAIKERDVVTQIFDGVCEGLSGTEIAEALGLSEQEYETQRIWMLRKLRKVLPSG